MKYLSLAHRREDASHRAHMRKPMRPSSSKPGDADTESKAVEYARQLIERRGLDISAMAIAAQAEFNAAFPPKVERSGNRKWTVDDKRAIAASLGYSTLVRWDACAAGMRPRFVEFVFMDWDSYRKRPVKVYTTFYRFELPHWDFQHPDDTGGEPEQEPEPAYAVAA